METSTTANTNAGLHARIHENSVLSLDTSNQNLVTILDDIETLYRGNGFYLSDHQIITLTRDTPDPQLLAKNFFAAVFDGTEIMFSTKAGLQPKPILRQGTLVVTSDLTWQLHTYKVELASQQPFYLWFCYDNQLMFSAAVNRLVIELDG